MFSIEGTEDTELKITSKTSITSIRELFLACRDLPYKCQKVNCGAGLRDFGVKGFLSENPKWHFRGKGNNSA